MTLFREYFFDCSIIEIEGRAFEVREYFLEDIIQLLNFQINPLNSSQRKHNSSKNRAMNDELDEELGYEDSQGEENEVRSSILDLEMSSFRFSGHQSQRDLWKRIFSSNSDCDESTERKDSFLRIDRGSFETVVGFTSLSLSSV